MRTPTTKGRGKLFLLGLILITVLLGSCSPRDGNKAAPAAQAAPPRSVTLAFVQGEVLVDGKAADVGQDLGRSFVVQTGPDSRCDIVFDGGNVLSVGQNSLAELDLKELVAKVRLEKGGLTSVLTKLEKLASQDSFTVQTKSAVAGVRGTSFCVWATEDSTYVCACNGEVRTIDAGGSNVIDLAAAHHSARIYTRSAAGFAVATAGIEHHSDESVQSAADRIGYKVDWSRYGN